VSYIFLFLYVIENIDDAQSFLGYVFSTKLPFHILFSSASSAQVPAYHAASFWQDVVLQLG